MPFIQPTGVSLSGSRGNLTNPRTSTNTAPSLISNTSATSLPATRKKFEPEKLCQVRNQWVRSADDSIYIFTKTWQPFNVPVLSVIVFVHDIMEHCERYQPLFVQFAARGMEVQSFDLPGFGETGAREDAYGITGGYDVLLKEMDSAIDRAQNSYPSLPIFLMGHGMGGALVLNYVCGLGQRKWYPNIGIGFRVQAEELTRDLAEQERFLGDGLIRDSVSLQCLGDMIYQGQKILKKRWKKFPAPLPTLLLHGTDDPICSYKATHTLSSQLLKLQPLSFMFKSWKGNMHDPHWDLDANSVRSEYTTWIRNNCRHFDRLPLEPSMVHWDSIRSSRSTATSSRSIRHTTSNQSSSFSTDDPSKKGKNDKKAEKKREKKEKKDRKKQEKIDKAEKKKQQKLAGKQQQGKGSMVAGSGQEDAQIGEVTAAPVKTLSNPANAEPEAIQDLEGLRRQQELRKLKAIEKRREYNLEPPAPVMEAAPPIGPTDPALPAVEEQQQRQQQQQQVEPVPPVSPAPQVEQQHQQQQQGIILTVITEPCSPTITTPPLQQPLPNTIQSTLSQQQQQTEMEKSLEAIALTLSRGSSLNHLPSAVTADIAIEESANNSVVVVAPVAPEDVTEEATIRAFTTTTASAAAAAEEIALQAQDLTSTATTTTYVNETPAPTFHIDSSPENAPSPLLIEKALEAISPTESTTPPRLTTTSLPGQFPS
ncbi:hypothetical protein BG015_009634 [Linnemannia schmuckeri]|uniref:Serine aminopeptidase S33 domain-containing protein n=1 Tax=Linnemannia schmuckeri TaxID=64567 RepID=A0A9P5RV89_9FUNG|nr:hypothetical protein BG015_009634 [Linnemannia schmuckeri]